MPFQLSRGPFGGRSRTPRRLTAWGLGPQMTDQSITATGKVIWSTGIGIVEQVATLVRTRGAFMARVLSVAAATDSMVGAIGLGIVSTDAFAVGATAVPGPFTDPEWDGWLWHQYYTLAGVTATAADGSNAVGFVRRFEIDSKAMRKINGNEILMGVFEVGVETGTMSIRVSGDTRILLKIA